MWQSPTSSAGGWMWLLGNPLMLWMISYKTNGFTRQSIPFLIIMVHKDESFTFDLPLKNRVRGIPHWYTFILEEFSFKTLYILKFTGIIGRHFSNSQASLNHGNNFHLTHFFKFDVFSSIIVSYFLNSTVS